MLAIVSVQRRRSDGGFRLWLPVPLIVVWLLLLPFAVVLLPVFVIACWGARLPALRTLLACWGVASALSGLWFAIEQSQTSVRVRLA